MPQNFIHLHLHTEYSIVDGIVRIDPLLNKCCSEKMAAVAITDQSNLFGLIKFYRRAISHGIKPIVGVEIFLQNPNEISKPFKIVLLAQNNTGYLNIINITSRSYLEGQAQGVPIVERAWLEENNAGIIVLSGGKDGDIGQGVLSKKPELGADLLERWRRFFPERFYLELQRIGRENEEEYIHHALELSERYQVPVVATNNVRFLNTDDFEAHEARVCIHDGYVLTDTKRPQIYTQQQSFLSQAKMLQLFADIPEALTNSVEIAKRCNVDIVLGKNHLPVFPVPANITLDEHFTQEANSGLQDRLKTIKSDNAADNALNIQNYQKRLDYEIGIIKQTGFVSYFLIVADFIRWAKLNGIPVGPGRGSGAGSLVAYALKITNIDPMQHELFFERFLNPERVSLPDFDVDFCMDGRDRVIEYVIKRYGKDRVAQIITYGTMAARAVVRDVGRVLGHPYGFVDKLAKLIPFELGITLEKALEDDELLKRRYEEEDEVKALIDLALKLEGITRNAGKHAGGVVIAPSPLIDFMPLYCEEQGEGVVTQFDKYDVEDIGLVKFDFLGLRTLTIINLALSFINEKKFKNKEDPIDITTIPLDDEKTYKLLQECKTTAVFQLETRGMTDLVKRLQPDCFDDIVATVALFRPGPLQSGMLDDFVARKFKRAAVNYLHPALEPILRSTYGVIVYQEQVMLIAQSLAGYTLGEADILRRAMGKKKPEEMALQRAVFLEGAKKNNIDPHIANNIFDLMEKFAGYGFNKSHSVAYALITYQTAWLKAHYTAELMAAALSSDMDNTDKVVVLLNDCKKLGLVIINPDVNISGYQFSVNEDGAIVYGLGAIKGAGKAAIEGIIASRNIQGSFTNLFDFCNRVDTKKINRRVLEALICAGAFDSLAPHRASLIATLEVALKAANQHSSDLVSGQTDLFSLLDEAEKEHTKIEYVACASWPDEERLRREKNVLGYYLAGHPIERYKNDLAHFISCSIADLIVAEKKVVRIAGFINAVRYLHTKSGNKLAVITLEDDTAKIDVTVFSDLYETTRDLLVVDQLLIVDGEVDIDSYNDSKRIRAVSIWNLEQLWGKYAKALWIKLAGDELINERIISLQNILKRYLGGTIPVFLMYKNQGAVAKVALGDTWKVKVKESLIKELRQIFGDTNVKTV